jgi:hypothetical protein
VLCACYHTHGYSFVLHACCRARFASNAHAETAALEGTTFACAPCLKHLLQHTSEIDETFTYNIRLQHIYMWTLQYMQHPDKTLATYV